MKGKGGEEVLEAFYNTKVENIRLTFISNVGEEIKIKYINDTRINTSSTIKRNLI